MKTLIVIGTIILSVNLHASPFDVTGQNPDLYDGHANSTILPTAVQPGAGDAYASAILHSGGYAKTAHTFQGGIDEGYANILIDTGTPLNW